MDFARTYENALLIEFSGVRLRMIDIHDLIKNKEQFNREGEKSLMDKYDVEVLKKILKKKEGR